MKIEIEIDKEKKAIKQIVGLDDFNPIEIAMIMNQISLRALSMIEDVKEKSTIIQPKNKIVGV